LNCCRIWNFVSCFCLLFRIYIRQRPDLIKVFYLQPAWSNISLFLLGFIEVLEKEVCATCTDEQWNRYGLGNLSFWHVHGCFITWSVALVVVDSVILILFLGGELWLSSKTVRVSKIAAVFRIVWKCLGNFIFNLRQFLF